MLKRKKNIKEFTKSYNVKKKIKRINDSMTFSLLNECINNYINTIKNEKKINTLLKIKKIRLSNFPSHISENIVKYAILKKYKIMPHWDTKTGDLVINKIPKSIKCEIKGSLDLSNSLSSFGPNEIWDRIYFVDGVKNNKKKYKVYEIKLSNCSNIWKNIKINKKQTFSDQCKQKRRPRITFKKLQIQLGKHCKIIFNGYLTELDNTI